MVVHDRKRHDTMKLVSLRSLGFHIVTSIIPTNKLALTYLGICLCMSTPMLNINCYTSFVLSSHHERKTNRPQNTHGAWGSGM